MCVCVFNGGAVCGLGFCADSYGHACNMVEEIEFGQLEDQWSQLG